MPYYLRRDAKPQDYFTPEEKLVHAALHRAGYRGYDETDEGPDAVTMQDFTPTSVLYRTYLNYWAGLGYWGKAELVEEGCDVRPLNMREFGVALCRVLPHLSEADSGKHRARFNHHGRRMWGYLGVKGPDSIEVEPIDPTKWENPRRDDRAMQWRTDPVLRQMEAAVAAQHGTEAPQWTREKTAYDEYCRLVDDDEDIDRRFAAGLPELRPLRFNYVIPHFRKHMGWRKIDGRAARSRLTPTKRVQLRRAFKQGTRGRAYMDLATKLAGLSQTQAYAIVEDLTEKGKTRG